MTMTTGREPCDTMISFKAPKSLVEQIKRERAATGVPISERLRRALLSREAAPRRYYFETDELRSIEGGAKILTAEIHQRPWATLQAMFSCTGTATGKIRVEAVLCKGAGFPLAVTAQSLSAGETATLFFNRGLNAAGDPLGIATFHVLIKVSGEGAFVMNATATGELMPGACASLVLEEILDR